MMRLADTVERGLILVVDDDMDVRDAYAEILGDQGYRTVCLRDGRSALDYLRANPPPDAILLDAVMPGMDGYEFRRAQLNDPSWSQVPTIIISADRMVPRRWLEPGLAGFLTKPVHLPELLRAIERAVTKDAEHPLAAPPKTNEAASDARM